MRFYLSTMADITMDESGDSPVTLYTTPVSAPAAKKYGLGLELAEYCISDNLDRDFAATDETIRGKLPGFESVVLHAPYNELYPSAIDPKAVELARYRYDQCYAIAERYPVSKIVIHSGYVPMIYYPVWFVPRSIEFWGQFLADHPGNMQLCIENVMETEPDGLIEIAETINDPRLRLTFDVGHAFVTCHGDEKAVFDWLERSAPWLSHFHIHNNVGQWDTHSPLDEGSIPIEKFLHRAIELCPEASFTVECMESERCARWLREKGFLEE